MRRVPVFILAVLATLPALAGEAQGLLDRAVELHGGQAALGALPHLKRTGTVEDPGSGRSHDVVVFERADGGFRREVTREIRGRKTTLVTLYDGKVHKRKRGTSWSDMPLDEAREQAAHRLGFLAAAGASAAGARILGPATEAGVACDRVAVPDGRADAVLFLAQDDRRLVAIEYPATEAEGMGTKKDIVRKVVYRDHRRVGALLLPFDEESFHDGEPQGRVRYARIEVLDAFDDSLLKPPDPTQQFIPPEERAN